MRYIINTIKIRGLYQTIGSLSGMLSTPIGHSPCPYTISLLVTYGIHFRNTILVDGFTLLSNCLTARLDSICGFSL